MKNLFILILLSVGLYYAYEEGLLDDLLSDFQTGLALGSKSINELSCEEDVKNIAKNQELKNAFGLTFTIIKVKNIKEQSKTNKSITCVGDAVFDNAQESRLLMKVYEDTDGQIMYQFESEF